MSSKPNILILIGNFNMGGAETQAVQLARLLQDDGAYNVHVACFERRGVLLEEALRLGVGEIPEFPLTSFYDLNMGVQLRRFSRFVKEREIAVAHSQDFYMNVFGVLGAALARTPARIAFWGEMSRERTRAQMLLQRGCYRLAHAIHANSEAVRQDLVSLGVDETKIVTLYNGLDMRRITPPADFCADEARAALGLPRDGRRLVTIVANLRMEVKDYPTFLRAASRVRARVPDAAFVCAGEGELLGPMREGGGATGPVGSVRPQLYVRGLLEFDSRIHGRWPRGRRHGCRRRARSGRRR
jgi:glycosyltransferase involved in cell wall biosynthesis